MTTPPPPPPPQFYDDDERTLCDQGLEVVVIPYRPSPPQPKRKSSPPGPASPVKRTTRIDNVARTPSGTMSQRIFNNNSLITPRSQSALDEAMNQTIEAAMTPSSSSSSSSSSSLSPIDNYVDDVIVRPPPRGRAASIASPQQRRTQHCREIPSRVRSKSSPTSSSKSLNTSRRKLSRSPKKMGLYQTAKLGYQQLCNAIIRPPRSDYKTDVLGPEEFVFCGERFIRRDFGVVNERGLLLECSMWKKSGGDEDDDAVVAEIDDEDDSEFCEQLFLNVDDWDESKERGRLFLQVPEYDEDSSIDETSSAPWDNNHDTRVNDDDNASRDIFERDPPPGDTRDRRHYESTSPRAIYYGGVTRIRKCRRHPVVIYLHGNSSSRTEVIPNLAHLLSLGVSVVAFDFAGCGKSDGEFVSLGYYEQEDLQTVVHYLRSSGEVSAIALWGRSMGAATAIMYGSRDPTLSCMILDSAFTDLNGLAIEMVEKVKEQGFTVPNFVVSMTLRMIKSSIKSQAGFSIWRIAPIEHVNRCFIPAMFVAGDNDAFIDKRHSKRLYEMYAGDKNIVIVDGDHNSLRPRYMLQSACLFLQSCMQLSPSMELVIPMGTNLYLPPWLISDDNTPRASFKSGSRQQHLVQAQQSFHFIDSIDSGSSSTEDYTPEKIDYMPSELPDMNVRQKDIQSSLVKMLCQDEEKTILK